MKDMSIKIELVKEIELLVGQVVLFDVKIPGQS